MLENFIFNDTATPKLYTLAQHDGVPIRQDALPALLFSNQHAQTLRRAGHGKSRLDVSQILRPRGHAHLLNGERETKHTGLKRGLRVPQPFALHIGHAHA